MSSRKSGGTSDPSYKGKAVADVSNHGFNQLIDGVSDMNMSSAQDGGWEEVSGKKSKNRSRNNAPKLDMPSHTGSRRGSGQTWPTLSSDSKPVITPPPCQKNAWGGWSSRALFSQPSEDTQASEVDELVDDVSDDDDDDDDDECMSDDDDSDESQKSHETMKKDRRFKDLFQRLDGLSVDQINEPERQWHCPACKGGPGANDWYRGLQPLITHARTVKSRRANLHRKLAEVLDEELRVRGTSTVPAGEFFGKWKGLEGRGPDKQIVWPPMVIIMNTKLEQDEEGIWHGMGNPELLEYFSSYAAISACHSYGGRGHRGIGLLIFEASAVGYAEAECLSKHFEDTSKGRSAWEKNSERFYAGGLRLLYGYMAEKKDMDNFNKHSQGDKCKPVKYEMKSYQEMVMKPMRQMSEDNQQLLWFKNKLSEEQKSKKALEEFIVVMTEKLRKTTEENKVVKLRTKKHHQLNKEEMDFLERFYGDQMQDFQDKAKFIQSEN